MNASTFAKLPPLPPPPPGKTGWPWDTNDPTMDSSPLKITVVTPSYQQAHFIEETIRSVLLQGYSNLEYIIIDGGSTDGTVDIIRKYEKHLAYWVSEKDRGAADAIAKGFRHGTGPILGWLNSDDLYRPAALQTVAAAFLSGTANVVYGNTYWIDQLGEVLAEKRQTPFSRSGYLYGGADLQQPATFWTRDIYDKAGGIDESFRAAFDTDLFFRFVEAGAKFHYTPQFLAGFRVHSQQISDVLLETCRKELATLRARHLPYPIRSFRGRVLRNLARLERTFWYLRQGDLFWLIGRIPDRLKSRVVHEATGPASRWQ